MGIFGHNQDDIDRNAKQQYEEAQRKLEEARRQQQNQQLQAQPTSPSTTAVAAVSSKPLGPNDYDRYVVEKGDTLWAIARKVYGSGNDWHRIQQANPIVLKDPDVIHPGLVLRIPKMGKPLA
jgi:nucleoid-associated protein YgaU